MSALLALREAGRTLRTHRAWSLLTVFGIAWGTAALVLLVSWGEGFRTMVERGLSKNGQDLVYAWVGSPSEPFSPVANRRVLWLTRGDVDAVRAQTRLATSVVAESRRWSVVSAATGSLALDVRGIEAGTRRIRGVPLAAGRDASPVDIESRRRVALLGDRARERLFGSRSAIGAQIRIGGRRYEVIGLLARRGTQLAKDLTDLDEQVWIPITAFFDDGPRYGTEIDIVDTILFRLRNRADYDAACEEVRSILAKRLGVAASDPEVVLFASAVASLRQMPFDESRGFLAILSILTVALAGLGVTNMMLVSVNERRPEFALRLAVGARPPTVVRAVLVETLTVVGAGGALGLAVGLLSCAVLSRLQQPDVIPAPVVRWGVVAAAFVTVAVVGLLSGILPARRAARIEPAHILRGDVS